MNSDSSFGRLVDAWSNAAPGRAIATLWGSLGGQRVSVAERASADQTEVLWVGDWGNSRTSRVIASLARARHSYQIAPADVESDVEIEEILHECHPRLLVADAEWCAVTGMAAVRRLRRHAPGTDWALSWDEPSPRWLETLIVSGARGAVLHTDTDIALGRAFDAILAGQIWLPREVMRWVYATLVDAPSHTPTAPPPSKWPGDLELTLRETEVLELMRNGLTNREIGERLGISINTVKKHVASAYEKRGIRSRRQTLG